MKELKQKYYNDKDGLAMVKMPVELFLIHQAEQQLTGWKVGNYHTYSLGELICSSGLNKKEWEYIKKYMSANYLNEDELKEIDATLGDKQ